MRGRRGGCGRAIHGMPCPHGGPPVCYGCGRAGGRDDGVGRWHHVSNSEWWTHLGEWCDQLDHRQWTHERDLRADPPREGECVCSRTDCVVNLYKIFLGRRTRTEHGSRANMVVGQRSATGRYPSLGAQVRYPLCDLRRVYCHWCVSSSPTTVH